MDFSDIDSPFKKREKNWGQNIKFQLYEGVSLGGKYNVAQNIRHLKQAFDKC